MINNAHCDTFYHHALRLLDGERVLAIDASPAIDHEKKSKDDEKIVKVSRGKARFEVRFDVQIFALASTFPNLVCLVPSQFYLLPHHDICWSSLNAWTGATM